VTGMTPEMRRVCQMAAAVPVWLLGNLLLTSCISGDASLEWVDPGAAPLHPAYELVETMLVRNCAPCHSSGESSEEEGDDDDLDYSSCSGIVAGIDGIEEEVLSGGSMPPGAWPRLGEREKLILKRWIEDGACSPCNPCPP
jgi:hypothetical protein